VAKARQLRNQRTDNYKLLRKFSPAKILVSLAAATGL
jgi:hypothetical protein